ncbi:phage Tail Protein X family protein [Asticcacaulis biprosthecium C19]|uniref:Phage Tail Protein X family protein n=1 Tax=Asticcacaulis biprosthecium C19 TaxID=715226 RepID=F4QJD0_9CAUL|nr:tail protein X [Asticcacaulis biprosthecium]EGF93113.1 phage Tail Protein X family protein [Asticcacaulis biprosthecium C19]
MATRTATALQGETLDALVWRVLGATAEVVETVLGLNPGLATIADALPEGHEVTLPVLVTAPAKKLEIVQLWN